MGASVVATLLSEATVIGYFESNSPPMIFILPAIVFGFAGIFRKEQKWGLVALAAGLIAFVTRGGFQWRGSGETSDLRVLTWNVKRGAEGFSKIKAAIEAANADIIVLVDSDTETMNSGLPSYLSAHLPQYEFVRKGQMGIGSRLPIVSTQFIPSPSGLKTRPFLECVVRVKGQNVRVIAAHLARPSLTKIAKGDFREIRKSYQNHRSQVARLLQLTAKPAPTLLCGDFNMTPRSEDYEQISANFVDSFAVAGNGCGWTFPQPFGAMRLDYIWARGLTPVGASFGGSGASDHLAFIADLRLDARR